jgi:hypothetical protein
MFTLGPGIWACPIVVKKHAAIKDDTNPQRRRFMFVSPKKLSVQIITLAPGCDPSTMSFILRLGVAALPVGVLYRASVGRQLRK